MTLIKELGPEENHASNSKTYETGVDKTTDQLINSHANTVSKHFKIYFNAENKFWTILNNQIVIDAIKNQNNRDKAKSTCFDFSTLHTKIPHGKLMRNLSEYIEF